MSTAAANESILDTIAPKSDQLNADDLIGGPITVKIIGVRRGATAEQPVAIAIQGRKPYLPCKSMRRVLVASWGPMPSAWIGRELTLYCDPKVMFGGVQVGGIRIGAMSHLPTKDVSHMLTTTRSKRAPFTVRRIETRDHQPERPIETPEPEPGDAAELDHRQAEAMNAAEMEAASIREQYESAGDREQFDAAYARTKAANLPEPHLTTAKRAHEAAWKRLGLKAK